MCKKLATCMGLKSKSASEVDNNRKQMEISKSAAGKLYLHNHIMSDGVRHYLSTKPAASASSSRAESAAMATSTAAASRQNNSSDELLVQIRDLLQAKQLTKARRRNEKEKTQRMASDWILAAAVVDRICFFLITFIFIGGTIVFIIICALAAIDPDYL